MYFSTRTRILKCCAGNVHRVPGTYTENLHEESTISVGHSGGDLPTTQSLLKFMKVKKLLGLFKNKRL